MATTERKIAAVWARVSTDKQTSLPEQVAKAKAKAESEGYIVLDDLIFQVDFTSLALFDCPQFQTLWDLIDKRNSKWNVTRIDAVAMLNRDRLPANTNERMLVIGTAHNRGVKLLVAEGEPFNDSDSGFVIEAARTLGKKEQVLRSKMGAKTGLSFRVKNNGRPVNRHPMFGFKWEGFFKIVKNEETWHIRKLICDMAYAGKTLYEIKAELENRGHLTFKGSIVWKVGSLSAMLTSPVNAGRYYALGTEAVIPKKRKQELGKEQTYGLSSRIRKTLKDSVYLPKVEIVDPCLTWGQYLELADIKKKHMDNKRNARHDYLLRSMVHCHEHKNPDGSPRKFSARRHGNGYIYACPVTGCTHRTIKGKPLEDAVKKEIVSILNSEPEDVMEKLSNKKTKRATEAKLVGELEVIRSRKLRNAKAFERLETQYLLGEYDNRPEFYEKTKANFNEQRDKMDRAEVDIERQLVELSLDTGVVATIKELRKEYKDNLHSLGQSEWRNLLERIDTRIDVYKVDEEYLANQWFDGAYPDGIQIGFSLPIEQAVTHSFDSIQPRSI